MKGTIIIAEAIGMDRIPADKFIRKGGLIDESGVAIVDDLIGVWGGDGGEEIVTGDKGA